MAAFTKVSHVRKQPTSLGGEMGSVSQISMATQITLGSRKNVMQRQNPRLTLINRYFLGPKSLSAVQLRIQDGGVGLNSLSSSETWKLGSRFP